MSWALLAFGRRGMKRKVFPRFATPAAVDVSGASPAMAAPKFRDY